MAHMTHPVDEVLPLPAMLAVGIQHVLVMYAGAIAVPLIIGAALKLPKDQVAFLISSDLFACGIVTLVQCIGVWKFGIRLPVIMGVSFAPVGPMVAMASSGAGLTAIFGATIAAGVFAILIAPFFGRLMRFFPPIVTGTIILTIGMTLFPVAINWAGGGRGAPNFGDPKNLMIAGIVLLAILVINKYLRGFLANISVLLGMAIGFAVALALGLVDVSGTAQAAWFSPVRPFAFGWPTFDIAAIASLCLVMVVIMVESLGMFLALGDLAGRPVSRGDATRGLRTDGLGTVIGGIFNTFPHSSFSQNIGLVGITGVKSRWVVAVSGVILILLGLLPKLSNLIASIPVVVLGGAGIAMFGMVAATGVKILGKVDYESKNNLLIIAISLGVGVIPLVAPTFFAHMPPWAGPLTHSGITLAAVFAILLNAFFNRGRAAADVEREIAGEMPLSLRQGEE
ncbi:MULTISPECIES: nucleobase:cation symporter-2 family protein [unclassified Caballeronia]|uniref:nucleobase:cation symporter-2 family protein n=1 Tax=unclassified Caballeronia TaxID=2646786 RepID=UPI002854D342|nr:MULTISPECIES: nucleobase:cation symporter-2 family protein [unclassified Caballeronia]MDR5775103.1 nucleobase:cation symporter-2 family protein [Caballeronia sp. LZ002]MDR5850541.1 nucleobase:cation symporter-2 family protein [Caballeronia sp. LZ003]